MKLHSCMYINNVIIAFIYFHILNKNYSNNMPFVILVVLSVLSKCAKLFHDIS